MPIAIRNAKGMLVRQKTPDYVCDRLLDLLEEKPLHQIKVKHLTDFAGIARNTFFTYFDSVYAVAQRMEDRYLEGFFPENVANAVLVKGSTKANAEHLRELGRDARVVQILCGPHGDPYFPERLGRRIKKICNRIWDENGSSYTPKEREAFCSFITGGTIYLTRYLASLEDDYSQIDLEELGRRVIQANSALFGFEAADLAL